MNSMTEYLNIKADIIDFSSKQAGIVGHKGNIGENRENIIGEFLKDHLPKRLLQYYGGNVIGLNKTCSKQLDIMITNDISINFLENSKMTTFVESLVSAISVKTTLNKPTLIDSLENIASIPQLDKTVLELKGYINPEAIDDFLNKHPHFFIFAYDGINSDTILNHLNEYYAAHPEIPKNRYPNAIIVNGKYMITFHNKVKTTTTGYVIPPNTFFKMDLVDKMKGFPLGLLLNNLSSYVDWLPYMCLNSHHYINSGYDL